MNSITLFGSRIDIRLILLLALAVFFLCIGLYYVLTEFAVSASSKARKAVIAHKRNASNFSERITIPIAQKIVRFVHLDDNKKDVLQKKLYSAEIHYSPEFYTAKAVADGILIGLFSIPVYIISPIFSMMCIVLGVAVYFKRMQELDAIIKKKSEKIENELVLFANTIKQHLASSRDIIKIFESYRKICGPELMHELDMTIADMKTGSYEGALRRFESRIPSAGLSEIIRGLLAVMRGDDQQSFFEMLAHDLMVESKEKMKRSALKRPEKLKGVSYLMMFMFMALYFYAIGFQIAQNLGEMF